MTIGWHLAQQDSRDDFVRDPVGHADFASDLTDRLRYLIEQVEEHRYRPKHLLEIDIPKSGLAVRPGNVLPIEEAALLHAVVYVLAPKLDTLLSPQVFSYRLHKDWKAKAKRGESLFKEGEVAFPFLKRATINTFSPFEAWYDQWPEFEAASKRAATEDGYTHLTRTDITSYFENIDLRLLMDQIRSRLKQQEDKILQLLFRVLEGWRRTTSAGIPLDRGIPQGNEVSSFLGNLYLLPLDEALSKFCKRRSAMWFRYMDDVKVFTKEATHAREAVFVVNEALRSLHLNLQGSKTQILSGTDLIDHLDTTIMDRITAASDEITQALRKKPNNEKQITGALKSISPLCRRFTTGLPRSVQNLKSEDSRVFRRLLAAYGRAGRSRKGLPDAALAAIRELPDLRVLRSCLRYLCQLPYAQHDKIIEELLGMAERNELPFPYQVGTMLESLSDFHPEKAVEKIGSRIRRYAFGSNLGRKRDWLIIAKGLESLGTFPYAEAHFDTIIAHYVEHGHFMVRRAAVAVAPRCKKDLARKRLGSLVRHPDSGISRLAIWLQRLHLDREFAKMELGRLRKATLHDRSVLTKLPILYAASATEDAEIRDQVLQTLNTIPTSQSFKLTWHMDQLRKRVAWD